MHIRVALERTWLCECESVPVTVADIVAVVISFTLSLPIPCRARVSCHTVLGRSAFMANMAYLFPVLALVKVMVVAVGMPFMVAEQSVVFKVAVVAMVIAVGHGTVDRDHEYK